MIPLYSFSRFNNIEYGAEVKLMTHRDKTYDQRFLRAIINDVDVDKLMLYGNFSCSKYLFNYFVCCRNDSVV